jgi:hypothetical protein
MKQEAEDVTRKIARAVDLLVRLKIDEVKGTRNQSDLVKFLAGLGATAAEISSLTNLKRTTVDPILSRSRASVAPAKRRSARKGRE